MQVLKFGGTSMGDEDTWRKVLDIICKYDRPVVIVSATARTTRKLIAAAEEAITNVDHACSMAEEIGKRHRDLIDNFMVHFNSEETKVAERKKRCDQWISRCIKSLKTQLDQIDRDRQLSPRRRDVVSSIGEQLSSKLLVHAAAVFGIQAQWIDAREVIKTDLEYGSATPQQDPLPKSVRPLCNAVEKGIVPIMGGYYGEGPDGTITTLGFEGSDLSASLVGAALGADAIEIWTDVSGVYTCDPRLVDGAVSIPELSYREASDLAFLGAKVLHPATMSPAKEKGIPIWVRNIFAPEHPGTKIGSTPAVNGYAKAMAQLNKATVLKIKASGETTASDLSEESIAGIFKAHRLPIVALESSANAITVAYKKNRDTAGLIEALKEWGVVKQYEGYGVISLVGCKPAPDKAAELKNHILKEYADCEPSMVSFNNNHSILSIVLPQDALEDTIGKLHREFFVAKDTKSKSGSPA